MHPALGVASFLVLAPTLLAQNLWVVDSQNRPGTTHLTLASAVGSSAPGDRIRVRDGINSVVGFTIDRPVRIFGDPGAVLNVSFGPIVVQNIPGGSDFALSGVRLQVSLLTTQRILSIRDCQGRVHIDDVQGSTFGAASFAVIALERVQQAVLDRVTLAGPDALAVVDSTVAIVASDLRHAPLVYGRGTISAALQCYRSQVQLAETTVTGADGIPQLSAGTMAIHADNATIRIGTAAVIAAGNGTGQMAIDGVASTITADPAVAIVPSGGAPATGAGITLLRAPVPTLQAATELATGVVRVALHGASGELAGIVIGMPGPRVTIPGIGEVWLDPASLITATIGVASGDLVFTMQSSTSPELLGALVYWQGAVLSATGVALTNPSGYVHR
jgi:hypothetical protein